MSFPLAGNERLKATLLTALSANRLPHAIILEGDSGLGKRTLGLWLAKAALCASKEQPCGGCRSCELFDAGTHPDFITVAPENGKKSVTVDRIRELRRQAFVKPHISLRRVFLLADCDAMNEQAQNALLKILEEPPGAAVFILTAASRAALLETVVSRCVILTLSAPERAQGLEVLKRLCADKEASEEALSAALEAAAGNIGAALAELGGIKNEAVDTAKKFVSLLSSGSKTEMLMLLQPFSRDRAAADRLIAALKKETAAALRSSYKNTALARCLNRFYSQLAEYSELLKTNINLPLLFTAMVSRIER